MLSEQKITFEVAAWIDRKWVISDTVALELFHQYRGTSDYPFDGVGPSGIVDDADGLINDIEEVLRALNEVPAPGGQSRRNELDALKGWVRHWQASHTDVDGYRQDRINQLRSGTRKRGL